ncbi:pyridoxal phosphate-dependent aminotransferase [Paramaledivibacter caminithermalis]|uniref:Aspartate/methionine/tyrosine aminotransferase n=1 Tax=Paramaledivibacter caminithermalis (strain DSM 15212 / CIP 107654 / DViRD3) TaxID=1121301 RepID=A0A1M6RI28_PARC5|nr:pyridoxal phosphate-dependent aminotransferase [Paramaledivibacter caminithermalis]SHK32093.1 Aspartate/methionine/tyrosine aminotransferase [Paramaledivibacter caminithermalis DSM 15212]
MKHRFISKRYWNDISTPMGKIGNFIRKYDNLINLSLGDPDLTTDERIINLAFEDAKNGHTHYTDFLGDIELREEICKYYKNTYSYYVKLEECMITTSGCHGMWLVLESILDDGDEVIIHEPYFTPYPQQIKLARGKPVILETYEEDEFQVDTQRLKGLITNRTKAIIINTPNNPTGTCFSRKTLEAIAKVAIQNDLIIIADDIYTSFSYAEPFIPITTLEGMKERTITIGSFSKDYCMTGWRIGYVLAPSFIIKTMKDVNENNVFTAPSISQRAALHALRLKDEIQPPMVEEYKKRIFYAYERINMIANMSILPPRGSLYLFINIKETGLSSMEVADRILHEAHVLVLPGNAFGAFGEGYIRIAVTVGLEQLKEAFDRIENIDIFNKKIY